MQIGMNWQAEAIRNQTLATKVLFSWDTFFAPWLLPPESNDRFWIIRSTSLPAYIVAIEQCNADILVFVGWIISYRNGKTNEKQQHRLLPSTIPNRNRTANSNKKKKRNIINWYRLSTRKCRSQTNITIHKTRTTYRHRHCAWRTAHGSKERQRVSAQTPRNVTVFFMPVSAAWCSLILRLLLAHFYRERPLAFLSLLASIAIFFHPKNVLQHIFSVLILIYSMLIRHSDTQAFVSCNGNLLNHIIFFASFLRFVFDCCEFCICSMSLLARRTSLVCMTWWTMRTGRFRRPKRNDRFVMRNESSAHAQRTQYTTRSFDHHIAGASVTQCAPQTKGKKSQCNRCLPIIVFFSRIFFLWASHHRWTNDMRLHRWRCCCWCIRSPKAKADKYDKRNYTIIRKTTNWEI